MPTYAVTTDQGKFKVTLDRAPASDQELQALVSQQLSTATGSAPPPAAPELPKPSLGRRILNEAGERFKSDVKMAKGLVPSILPTAGALGGAALGGMAGTLALPIVGTVGGAVAGEIAGSVAGEAANQALGITEPSAAQLGLAAAGPVAVRALGAGYRAVKGLRPSALTESLNVAGPEAANSAVQKFRLTGPSANELFTQATDAGGQIRMGQTMATVDKFRKQAELSSAGKKLKSEVYDRMEDVAGDIAAAKGRLTPSQLQAQLNAIGELRGKLAAAKHPGSGEAAQLYDALMTDLDLAATKAGGHGSAVLKQARLGYLRSQSVNEIETAVEKATRTLKGQTTDQFNANMVVNELKKNKYFTKAFSVQEQAEIFGIFGLLTRIPTLPPPQGVTRGSEAMLRLGGAASLGGGVGYAQSGPEGAVTGALAGAGLVKGYQSMRLIGLAMQFPEGRALVKNLVIAGKGDLTPKALGAVGAFLSAQVAETDEE